MTEPNDIPRRAFTQGVGTVFQGVGATMFLVMMTTCCLSSLWGKDAERPDLDAIGWPGYSVARAMSVGMVGGVGLFIGVAAVGLGLQATRRSSVAGGVIVSVTGVLFWGVHLVFAIAAAKSFWLSLIAGVMVLIFAGLLGLAVGAWREMRRDPPEPGHEVLPEGYKVPYSWYHDDPPEVRLARELEERRRKLAVQQKELEELEEKIRKGKL